MEQKVIQAATQWEYTKFLEEAIVEGYRVLSYDSVQHMPQNNGVFISVTMQKSSPKKEEKMTGEQIVAEKQAQEKPEPADELQEAVKSVKANTVRKQKP